MDNSFICGMLSSSLLRDDVTMHHDSSVLHSFAVAVVGARSAVGHYTEGEPVFSSTTALAKGEAGGSGDSGTRYPPSEYMYAQSYDALQE